ncbi:hypothetical protein [Caulobacter phage Cr30]|uniref:hypothetical protein n=1 Tax=Caulobacter phage Cr30 TaxID=1357714 RepID=UPI0004A9BAB4|nr:hypothetical protein OZ74_gp024 [Caulobacter phage Cr30]AGS80909.1 hypothetical protein [Caulobacter phage Cr30]
MFSSLVEFFKKLFRKKQKETSIDLYVKHMKARAQSGPSQEIIPQITPEQRIQSLLTPKTYDYAKEDDDLPFISTSK